MDLDDLVEYVVLQPQGDQPRACACGCARELLPEEVGICADRAADRHHRADA